LGHAIFLGTAAGKGKEGKKERGGGIRGKKSQNGAARGVQGKKGAVVFFCRASFFFLKGMAAGCLSFFLGPRRSVTLLSKVLLGGWGVIIGVVGIDIDFGSSSGFHWAPKDTADGPIDGPRGVHEERSLRASMIVRWIRRGVRSRR